MAQVEKRGRIWFYCRDLDDFPASLSTSTSCQSSSTGGPKALKHWAVILDDLDDDDPSEVNKRILYEANHLSSEQINMKWKLIERKYALRSITKKQLNVPEKPKLKCLGFTYNRAKLFNMLPMKMKKMEDPNTFKTMTKEWIWENIPSY